jgi:hypothetical protein
MVVGPEELSFSDEKREKCVALRRPFEEKDRSERFSFLAQLSAW